MSDEKKGNKLSAEDLMEILEKISQVYEEAGKSIETAVLYKEGEEEPEILIDNREEKNIH